MSTSIAEMKLSKNRESSSNNCSSTNSTRNSSRDPGNAISASTSTTKSDARARNRGECKASRSSRYPSSASASTSTSTTPSKHHPSKPDSNQFKRHSNAKQKPMKNKGKPMIDFIGPANAVKDLFALPYTNTDVGVSVALHNMGDGTLLLDAGDAAVLHRPNGLYEEEDQGIEKADEEGGDLNDAGTSVRMGRRRRRRDTTTPFLSPASSSSSSLNQTPYSLLSEWGKDHNTNTHSTAVASTLPMISSMLQHQQDQIAMMPLPLSETNVVANPPTSAPNTYSTSITTLMTSPAKPKPSVLPTTTTATLSSPPPQSTNILSLPDRNGPFSSTILPNSVATSSTTTQSTDFSYNHANSNVNDKLRHILPSPEHYTQSIISVPDMPRQYLHWKFHNHNFVVASDAFIFHPQSSQQQHQHPSGPNDCDKEPSGGGNVSQPHPSSQRNNDTNTTNSNSLMSQALTVRITDGHELRSKLKLHEEMMVQSNSVLASFSETEQHRSVVRRGIMEGNHDDVGGKVYYSSYAEALSRPLLEDVKMVAAEEGEDGFKNKGKEISSMNPNDGNSAIMVLENDANNNVDAIGLAKEKYNKDDDALALKSNRSFSQPDLDQVQLQTCVVPSSNVQSQLREYGFSATTGGNWSKDGRDGNVVSSLDADNGLNAMGNGGDDESPRNRATSSSAVCTVLDAYLDNIMANVPQLALCLQEKGFIQSIKLLRTEDIPALSTFDLDVSATGSGVGGLNSPNGGGIAGSGGFDGGATGSAGSATTARGEPLFSPNIVDSNASMLLRFLKTNCSRENTTYLLRRNAGETNIHLYDITSISRKRQIKWIWWLAMMSYRFALRLDQLAKSVVPREDEAMKRNFRSRQRSLLQNSLELLEELADMDGGNHETICAAVSEHLADTFLWNDRNGLDTSTHNHQQASSSSSSSMPATSSTPKKNIRRKYSMSATDRPHTFPKDNFDPKNSETFNSSFSHPSPTTSSSQPYNNVNADGLTKAQDYLMDGIRKLKPALDRAFKKAKLEAVAMRKKRREQRKKAAARHARVIVVHDYTSSSSSDEEEFDSFEHHDQQEAIRKSIEIEAISMQLYGLHHKLINVSLRLAEHYLRSYWSSSAMQALRTAGRRISDASKLLGPLELFVNLKDEAYEQKEYDFTSNTTHAQNSPRNAFIDSISYQYAWLWEYCGHFARSFAADVLWRERGHACGEDVISLLQDVEMACSCVGDIVGKVFVNTDQGEAKPNTELNCDGFHISPITSKTGGLVNLQSLSGLVPISSVEDESKQNEYISKANALETAKEILENQKQVKREERRVLVAAAICYSRATGIFTKLVHGLSKDTRDEESTSIVDGVSSLNTTASSHTVGQVHPLSLDASILSLLRQRLGDACNEIGKILLTEVKGLLSLSTSHTSEKPNSSFLPVAPLLLSAEFWFTEGLYQFEMCGDKCNVALLRCNLCQCCKIRANANVDLPKKTASNGESSASAQNSHAESCLQDAAKNLELAHEALEHREAVDPMTWDMVSEELGATFLILGVRRRQSLIGGGSSPLVVQALRLNPGKERSIIEPMERAKEIYKSLGNSHQAAAAHYQLALFYSKVWTCQRDETKTREKLSAAFSNFSAAHHYYFSQMRSNEPTFVILSLDLSNLYSAVSGELECLYKALLCCLDTCDAFSPDALSDAKTRCSDKGTRRQDGQSDDWLDKMKTLATSIEERVFKLLLNLVKIEKEGSTNLSQKAKSNLASSKFKNLYRVALTAKMASRSSSCDKAELNEFLSFPVHHLLSEVKNENKRLDNS